MDLRNLPSEERNFHANLLWISLPELPIRIAAICFRGVQTGDGAFVSEGNDHVVAVLKHSDGAMLTAIPDSTTGCLVGDPITRES
jgi:hypothetical protein